MYATAVYGTYLLLTRAWDGFYATVVLVTLSVLIAAVLLAAAGVSTPQCLLVVTAAPIAVVAGYEWLGHQRTSAALAGGAEWGGGP